MKIRGRGDSEYRGLHLFMYGYGKVSKGAFTQSNFFYEDIMLRVFFLVEKFRFKFMYSDVITSWSEEEFVNQFKSSQIKCIIKFV